MTKTLSQDFFHLDFLKGVGLDQTVDFSLSTDIDFEAIVRAELEERKGSNISDNCTYASPSLNCLLCLSLCTFHEHR